MRCSPSPWGSRPARRCGMARGRRRRAGAPGDRRRRRASPPNRGRRARAAPRAAVGALDRRTARRRHRVGRDAGAGGPDLHRPAPGGGSRLPDECARQVARHSQVELRLAGDGREPGAHEPRFRSRDIREAGGAGARRQPDRQRRRARGRPSAPRASARCRCATSLGRGCARRWPKIRSRPCAPRRRARCGRRRGRSASARPRPKRSPRCSIAPIVPSKSSGWRGSRSTPPAARTNVALTAAASRFATHDVGHRPGAGRAPSGIAPPRVDSGGRDALRYKGPMTSDPSDTNGATALDEDKRPAHTLVHRERRPLHGCVKCCTYHHRRSRRPARGVGIRPMDLGAPSRHDPSCSSRSRALVPRTSPRPAVSLDVSGRCKIHGRHPVLCRGTIRASCERRLPLEDATAWFHNARGWRTWLQKRTSASLGAPRGASPGRTPSSPRRHERRAHPVEALVASSGRSSRGRSR